MKYGCPPRSASTVWPASNHATIRALIKVGPTIKMGFAHELLSTPEDTLPSGPTLGPGHGRPSAPTFAMRTWIPCVGSTYTSMLKAHPVRTPATSLSRAWG